MSDILTSQRALEAQEAVRSVLEAPVPRTITPTVLKAARSPIAGLFMLLGVIFAAQWLLFAAFGVLNSPVAAMSTGVAAVVALTMCLGALFYNAQGRRILVNGRLYKGKVVAVSPLSARINGRTFFRVRVRFEAANGHVHVVKDTVDNFSVGHFLQARDKREDVEVLWYPNALGRAFLPARLVNLFD